MQYRLTLFLFIFLIGIPLGLALHLLPSGKPDRWVVEATDFGTLPGWRDDHHAAALSTFLTGCPRLLRQPSERKMGQLPQAGRLGDWHRMCEAAAEAVAGQAEARVFFEQNFQPLAIRLPKGARGLFTGYYEPLLTGSRDRSARYDIPIYARPSDLVEVDLGDFRSDLKGRRIAGSVRDGRLEPYASRAEINKGALDGRTVELFWTDDKVGLFFLQIQGSGRILLDDGSTVRVGYHGPNGHPYTSLGRLMIRRNILHPDHVSMQSIRDWLNDNSALADELMEENASYIFFRLLKGPGPVGAQGVALTAGRSLAVDRQVVPLGVPLWVSTHTPDPANPDGAEQPFNRLMVAQDTGGAIRGAARGDIFFGFGEEAERQAGHMSSTGTYYILVPKGIETSDQVAAR